MHLALKRLELPFALLLLALLSPTSGQADYQIQTGDRLQILVMKHPEYSLNLEVRPDGRISYFTGEIVAEGRTPEQVAEAITSQLRPYVSTPVVGVAPVVHTREFFVLGAVNQPGRFPLPVGGRLSLLQAIAAAGGIQVETASEFIQVLSEGQRDFRRLQSDEARRMDIQAGDVVWVRRLAEIRVSGQVASPGVFYIRSPISIAHALGLAGGAIHETAAMDGLVIYRTDGTHVTLDEDARDETKLQDGDTLYVPNAYLEKKLFVLGYVHNPGGYELKHPVTPLEAVALGGGVVENVADLKKIRLIRADGQVEQLNLLDYYEGRLDKPVLLHPGDALQVPRRRQINWSLVLTLVSLVSVTISIFRQ